MIVYSIVESIQIW